MKQYIKYLFLFVIITSSFYITEKTAILNRSNDPILKAIIDYSKDYNYEAVNAEINDNYITPGLYGKRVNEVKSLMKMKSDGVFNSIFLSFDDIKPEISLSNNKDKIINRGNKNKNAISFILENDETNVVTYLISNKINSDILVNKSSINQNKFFEQINNDFNNYSDVEKMLNKNKINTNICLISRNNKEYCIRNKKYLVEPTYVLNSSNLVTIKNKISSGDIILIKDNVSIDDVSYLVNYINSKGLKIIKLSELISEK